MSSPTTASRCSGYRSTTPCSQSYVLEAHRPHSLESLAQRHLGRSGLSYEDLCGKGVKQIPFSQVAVDQGHALQRARTAR